MIYACRKRKKHTCKNLCMIQWWEKMFFGLKQKEAEVQASIHRSMALKSIPCRAKKTNLEKNNNRLWKEQLDLEKFKVWKAAVNSSRYFWSNRQCLVAVCCCKCGRKMVAQACLPGSISHLLLGVLLLPWTCRRALQMYIHLKMGPAAAQQSVQDQPWRNQGDVQDLGTWMTALQVLQSLPSHVVLYRSSLAWLQSGQGASQKWIRKKNHC